MSEDLIKRSDAIGAITNHCENECYFRVDNWCPQCQREEFEEAIKAVPSAEITEADVLDYCRPRLLTIVAKEAILSADRPSAVDLSSVYSTAYKSGYEKGKADRLQDDAVSKGYLLAEIDDLADEFSEVDENGLHSERWCGIVDAKCVIVNAPSVSDRPQGEWIEAELDKGFRVCSVCKNKGYKDKMAWRTDFIKAYLNYCPNCGAKMKGADDEHDK